MANMPIEFKGNSFTLSVVYLHNKQPEIIRQALEKKIAQLPSSLKNIPIVVNIKNLTYPIHWNSLQQTVTELGLRIIGISGCRDPKLKAEIKNIGLPILTENKNVNVYKKQTKKIKPSLFYDKEKVNITKTVCIDIPVRSGQRIYAPNCDLVVVSHVSAGAELIADGNIHVYGVLRGRALAGASGNREAQIFCTNLAAELISIAGEYWLSDQIESKFYGKATRLRISNNNLTVQLLN